MTIQTLPRVFDGDNGHYVPNVRLAGPPMLEVGPPQPVTYHINGWRRPPDNGIWTRRGQRATLEFASFDGLLVGRAQIEGNLLQSQWREAGFDLTSWEWRTFNYELLLAPRLRSISPSQCDGWCSENIPPAGAGNSTSRLRSPTVDHSWRKVDTELDQTAVGPWWPEPSWPSPTKSPAVPLAGTPTIIYWRIYGTFRPVLAKDRVPPGGGRRRSDIAPC